jgi:hypothetical protein
LASGVPGDTKSDIFNLQTDPLPPAPQAVLERQVAEDVAEHDQLPAEAPAGVEVRSNYTWVNLNVDPN